MAEKRTINIDIKNNADKTANDFDNLNKSIDQTTKSTKNLDATFEEVYGELQPLTTRMGEAEDRLYELSLAGDTTSKEFQQLLTKVGQYRKVQIQTDLAVDAAATTMAQKLGGALGGATSGFAAVQGAMALVGTESEELEETLLKVQSALAIQQGVQGIRESIPAFKQLGEVAEKAFSNMTKGAKVFAVTGIGLLLTAVAIAIAKMDELKEIFDDTTDSQKALNDTTEAYANAQKDARIQVEKVGVAFKLAKEGVISKEEALEEYNSTLGDSLGSAKSLEEAEQIYIDKTDAYIQATSLRAQANALFEKAAEAQANAVIAQMETADEAATDYLKVFGATGVVATEIGNVFGVFDDANTSYRDQLNANIKAETDQRSNTLNNLAKDLLKQSALIANENDINLKGRTTAATNTAKELINIENEILEARFNLLEESEIKDRRLRALAFKKELEQIDEQNISLEQKAELVKLKTEQFNKDLADIRIKWYEKEIEGRQEFLDFNNELRQKEVDAEKAKNLAILDDAVKTQKQKEALEKRNKEFAVQSTLDGLTLISNLTELFGKKGEKQAKKAFQIQKAAQIAAATIETYRSAQSAYLSQFLPVPDPSSPVRGGIAAGIAVAAGLTNIAKIASQKFEGGGATSGSSFDSGGDISAPATPSFNVVGDSGINQLAQLQQQPTQAYVVSGEVTTSQALDRNRVTNATL